MGDFLFRIAVCDDDEVFLEPFEEMLHSILDAMSISYEIVCFQSSQALLKTMENNQDAFNLIILDIIMENLDGMSLAEQLRKKQNKVMIIFISNEKEFALRGYQVNAKRYLAKPIDYIQLKEALLYCYHEQFQKKSLLIQTRADCRRVFMEDIYYIEVQNRGTMLVLEEDKIKTPSKISDWEAKLSGVGFIRCHQGFLVNLKYVERVKRYEILLEGNIHLPIGKLRYNDIRSKILNYLSL